MVDILWGRYLNEHILVVFSKYLIRQDGLGWAIILLSITEHVMCSLINIVGFPFNSCKIGILFFLLVLISFPASNK